MPKISIKSVALLLVGCLLWDPATAGLMPCRDIPGQASVHSSVTLTFSQQALTPAVVLAMLTPFHGLLKAQTIQPLAHALQESIEVSHTSLPVSHASLAANGFMYIVFLGTIAFAMLTPKMIGMARRWGRYYRAGYILNLQTDRIRLRIDRPHLPVTPAWANPHHFARLYVVRRILRQITEETRAPATEQIEQILSVFSQKNLLNDALLALMTTLPKIHSQTELNVFLHWFRVLSEGSPAAPGDSMIQRLLRFFYPPMWMIRPFWVLRTRALHNLHKRFEQHEAASKFVRIGFVLFDNAIDWNFAIEQAVLMQTTTREQMVSIIHEATRIEGLGEIPALYAGDARLHVGPAPHVVIHRLRSPAGGPETRQTWRMETIARNHLNLALENVLRLRTFLHSPVWGSYLSKIYRHVNPEFRDVKALYFASGPDVSTALLATGAKHIELVDASSWSDSTTPDELTKYVHVKEFFWLEDNQPKIGGLTNPIPQDAALRPYILMELFALGIKEVEEHDEPDLKRVTLKFLWKHPENRDAKPETHIITLHYETPIESFQTDQHFDLFLEKANSTNERAAWNQNREKLVGSALNPGGLIITSDKTAPNWWAEVFAEPLPAVPPLLESQFEFVPVSREIWDLERRGIPSEEVKELNIRASWGYGDLLIHQKRRAVSDSGKLAGASSPNIAISASVGVRLAAPRSVSIEPGMVAGRPLPRLTLASTSPRRIQILKEAWPPGFSIAAPKTTEVESGSPEEVVVENARRKAEAIASSPGAQREVDPLRWRLRQPGMYGLVSHLPHFAQRWVWAEGLVIGVDTVLISPDGHPLSSPMSLAKAQNGFGGASPVPLAEQKAREMLTSFSGRTIVVLSGVAIADPVTGKTETMVEETLIEFDRLSTAQIDRLAKKNLQNAGALAPEDIDQLATRNELHNSGVSAGQRSEDGVVARIIRGNADNSIGMPMTAVRTLLRRQGLRLFEPREPSTEVNTVPIPPNKGVGPSNELRKDLDVVLERARKAGGAHFESLDQYPDLDQFVREGTIQEFHEIRNIHWMGPTIEELETTLREADIRLVRDPARPNSPILSGRSWSHLAGASWEWDAKNQKGSINLPTVLVHEMLRRNAWRELLSLVGFETFKLASARFHPEMSGDIVERLARGLELEIATQAASDGFDVGMSPVEGIIADALQDYFAIPGPGGYILVAIHLSPKYPLAAAAGPDTQRLLQLPIFTAVFENISTYQENFCLPTASHFVHGGHKLLHVAAKNYFPWAIKQGQKFILAGGMYKQCLWGACDEILAKFSSLVSGRIEIHLPSQGSVYSGTDLPVDPRYYLDALRNRFGSPLEFTEEPGVKTNRLYRNRLGASLQFFTWNTFEALMEYLQGISSAANPFSRAEAPNSIRLLSLKSPAFPSISVKPNSPRSAEAIRGLDEGFIGDRQRYLQNSNSGKIPSPLVDQIYSRHWPLDMSDSRIHLTALFEGRSYEEPYSPKPNIGIEIQADAGTYVYSVEDGVIRQVYSQSPDGSDGVGIVYLHSEQTNLVWAYDGIRLDRIRALLRENREQGNNQKVRIRAGTLIGEIGFRDAELLENVLVPDDVMKAFGRTYNRLRLETYLVDPRPGNMIPCPPNSNQAVNPLLFLENLYGPQTGKDGPGRPSTGTLGHSKLAASA